MCETFNPGHEASNQTTTASADGGLCRLRDVLPEVLLRYGVAIPPDEAESFLTFADSPSGTLAEAVAC
jgi:hypothetical protein